MGIAMLGSTYSQYFDSINAEQFVVRTTFILIGISNFVGKFISGSFLDQTEDAPVIHQDAQVIQQDTPVIQQGAPVIQQDAPVV